MVSAAITKDRDVLQKYPTEKAEKLLKRLKEKGRYYEDPGFPGDEEKL